VPYCTGDVHTGNNVITYTDPDGVGPDVVFHHAGHDNVQKVIEWIDANFTHVPKLLSTGCSAGGAGAITNYYFLRNGVSAAEQATCSTTRADLPVERDTRCRCTR
jgi:hypothetical protein